MPDEENRKRSPVAHRPATLSVLLGGQALLGVASVWAEVPSQTDKPAVKSAAVAPVADVATQTALAAFLKDYHHALSTSNRPFLTEHTSFPLPFAEIEYNMEAKPHEAKLPSVAALLKARKRLLWPTELVPDGPQALNQLRRGVQKCHDPKSPDQPDFTQGEPAVQVHGDEATLSYLAEPCDAETHVVILTFARTGQTWRLRQRAVRVGTE